MVGLTISLVLMGTPMSNASPDLPVCPGVIRIQPAARSSLKDNSRAPSGNLMANLVAPYDNASRMFSTLVHVQLGLIAMQQSSSLLCHHRLRWGIIACDARGGIPELCCDLAPQRITHCQLHKACCVLEVLASKCRKSSVGQDTERI